MEYTTSEVAKKLGITKDTLFYYEKEGLLPVIERDKFKRRIYSESDVEWIYLICCLRETDMPICKIKTYISLLRSGKEASISQRREILAEHKTFIEEKIVRYQMLLRLIEKKLDFYDAALSVKNSADVKCADYSDEWEHFRGMLGGLKNG